MDIDRIIDAFEARSPARRARIGETVRLWVEGAASRRGAVEPCDARAGEAAAYPAFAHRAARAR